MQIKNDDYVIIICSTGTKVWTKNGQMHRENGPAVEYNNGDCEWFINGIGYTQEEWFDKLTPEQKEKAIWNMDNW